MARRRRCRRWSELISLFLLIGVWKRLLFLSQATRRFRSPAGARVPSLCWPKEKEPREMAWFNTPKLRAGCVEGIGATHGDPTSHTATPPRIWELRAPWLVAPLRARYTHSRPNACKLHPRRNTRSSRAFVRGLRTEFERAKGPGATPGLASASPEAFRGHGLPRLRIAAKRILRGHFHL